MNDNETFSAIGLFAALILNRLQCERALRMGREENENENAAQNGDRVNQSEQKPDAQREYVERRLAELAQWERSIDQDRLRRNRN